MTTDLYCLRLDHKQRVSILLEEKHEEVIEKILYENNKILLRIHTFAESQDIIHKIACEPLWNMVHILNALKMKEKKLFSNLLRKWNFRIYNSNPEKRIINPLNYDEVNNAEYIDMNMIVKQLKCADIMVFIYLVSGADIL